MGKEFLEHDKWSGLTYFTEFDHDEKRVVVRSEQDCTPIVERAKKMANEGIYDHRIKGPEDAGLRKVCDLPMSVAMEMLQKGVEPFPKDEAQWKAFFREINTNYPYLKTTHKKI